MNDVVKDIQLVKQEALCERQLVINGHPISDVLVCGMSNRHSYHFEPLVFSFVAQESKKKYYLVCRVEEESEMDYDLYLRLDAPGAIISHYPRSWGDLIPCEEYINEEYAGIPASYLRDLSSSEREELFRSEEEWEEEFEYQDEDYRDEEDTPEELEERKKEFFNCWTYLKAAPEDSVLFLDCYSHSGDAWSLAGSGTQCRWDTTSCAAVMLLNPYYTEIMQTHRQEAIRSIKKYLDRLSGETEAVLVPTCIIDAETYEVIDEVDDWCDIPMVRLHVPTCDVDTHKGSQAIYNALTDELLCSVEDLKVEKNVEFTKLSAVYV